MSNEVQVTKDDKPMEYVPFGAQDKIKLTVAIVQNLICVKTRSGKVCSANDAIKFMMLCQARKLNPFESDAYLIGYDGKDGPTFSLITAHQAFLKRAESNPEYDGMKSGIIIEENEQLKDVEGDFYTEGQKVVGGWATVYFKNRKYPMHKRIRLSRFQKSFGIWQDDSAGMICKCAEADALRSSFPTMLGGLYIREETPTDQAPVVASAPIFTAPESTTGKPEETKVEEKPTTPAPPLKSAKPKAEPRPETPAVIVILAKIGEAGVTEEQILGFLKQCGAIDGRLKDLEAVAQHEPESFALLTEQLDDMIKRIKETAAE